MHAVCSDEKKTVSECKEAVDAVVATAWTTTDGKVGKACPEYSGEAKKGGEKDDEKSMADHAEHHDDGHHRI